MMRTSTDIDRSTSRFQSKPYVTPSKEQVPAQFIPFSFKGSSSGSRMSASQTQDKKLVIEESKEKKLFEDDHKFDEDSHSDNEFERKIVPSNMQKRDDQPLFQKPQTEKVLMPPKKFK